LLEDHAGIDSEALERTIKPIAYIEQAAAVAGREQGKLARSDNDYHRVIARGREYRGTDYVEATYRRTQLRSRFVELFRRVNVLVTPTVAVTRSQPATLGVDEIEGRSVDRHLGWSPFSCRSSGGSAAATIPCGFDQQGLPVGMQIIAPWLEESRIFRVAAAFEAARPWRERWPVFAAG